MVVRESAGTQPTLTPGTSSDGQSADAGNLASDLAAVNFTQQADKNRKNALRSTEALTTFGLLGGAVLCLLFMGSMIAEPKALFGRSLASMSPELFPSIVLLIGAALCIAALLIIRIGAGEPDDEAMTKEEWLRGGLLFGIMTLYALTMAPFGFLISSAIAILLISLQMGSRSPLAIGLLALIGPVLLYLTATKLLLVALPELGPIEMLYARIFSL
jgi:putative tricarboxylic transport membrane protein